MTSRKEIVGVVVGTTEGPSVVLRIAVEAPEVRSVVCLNMSTEALAISPAYDAFIRRPTGVVERELGHAAYRADVSARIDGGNSWQLALYLAHRLEAEDRLASPGVAPDRWIWATGTLDSELGVGPIEELERKLAASADWLEARRNEGAPVTVAVPEGLADILTGVTLPPGVRTIATSRIEPLLEDLTLECRPAISAASRQAVDTVVPGDARQTGTARSMASIVLVGFLALAGVTAAAWMLDPSLIDAILARVGVTGAPGSSDAAATVPRASSDAFVKGSAAAPIDGEPVSRSNSIKTVVGPADSLPGPSFSPGPSYSIVWKIAPPKPGNRCRNAIAEPRVVANDTPVVGTVCQVTAMLQANGGGSVVVDLTVGFLGRFRDYVRGDRHVRRETLELAVGKPVELTLDVPRWVRGELRARAVALIAVAGGAKLSGLASLTSVELLSELPKVPAPVRAESSTITLIAE